MKRILVVSSCPKRGNTPGLTGQLLDFLDGLDKSKYQISLFDTSFFEAGHVATAYKAYHYYCLPKGLVSKVICKLPGLRSKFAAIQTISRFKSILNEQHFDGVILYQIPYYADSLVNAAHDNGTKIAFFPWGSEVLRVSGSALERMKNAYKGVDYVIGAPHSNTMIAAQELYKVPTDKLVEIRDELVGVEMIQKVKKQLLSKEDLSRIVGLPTSMFVIVCGYNGYQGQRHKLIIDAIEHIIGLLPKNYLLVFPVTYGAAEGYVKELNDLCCEKKLKSFFITDFMSDEQIACLHLITDLLIEIQPTDNGNAFLMEAIFAQNRIITGSWLGYKQYEQFGFPYYLIDRPEELASKLEQFFNHRLESITIPTQLIDMLTPQPEYDAKVVWESFFDRL